MPGGGENATRKASEPIEGAKPTSHPSSRAILKFLFPLTGQPQSRQRAQATTVPVRLTSGSACFLVKSLRLRFSFRLPCASARKLRLFFPQRDYMFRFFGLALVLAAGLVAVGVAHAQTLTTLASFNGGNGELPFAGLTLIGNTLYGTTAEGGAYGDGTVFALTIPEPSTIVLLASAACLFVFAWQRRRVK
jgi:uncharacterized repeat protein (TIGR03803 family)